MVLDELADLMTDVVPRLREMSEALRNDRPSSSEVSETNRWMWKLDMLSVRSFCRKMYSCIVVLSVPHE